MAEASWGEAGSPVLDWRMSAALENVPRGREDVAEVTSLEQAVRAWMELDEEHRSAATLTPDRALLLDGVTVSELHGASIAQLAERLPGRGAAEE